MTDGIPTRTSACRIGRGLRRFSGPQEATQLQAAPNAEPVDGAITSFSDWRTARKQRCKSVINLSALSGSRSIIAFTSTPPPKGLVPASGKNDDSDSLLRASTARSLGSILK